VCYTGTQLLPTFDRETEEGHPQNTDIADGGIGSTESIVPPSRDRIASREAGYRHESSVFAGCEKGFGALVYPEYTGGKGQREP
jgi:hypothetical protein